VHPEEARDEELEARVAIVLQRYGERLGPAEREAVREAVAMIVEAARQMRRVPLRNEDEPAQPFVPPREGG
jgi:hypothetical protein